MHQMHIHMYHTHTKHSPDDACFVVAMISSAPGDVVITIEDRPIVRAEVRNNFQNINTSTQQ